MSERYVEKILQHDVIKVVNIVTFLDVTFDLCSTKYVSK